MGLFGGRKTVFVDADILVIGGGMAGCGATYEARHWGRDLKIVCVEKANIERSGAVAQGLYAINCYMGMQWGENQPEDHVRYARNDLMGLVREDLGYDIVYVGHHRFADKTAFGGDVASEPSAPLIMLAAMLARCISAWPNV